MGESKVTSEFLADVSVSLDKRKRLLNDIYSRMAHRDEAKRRCVYGSIPPMETTFSSPEALKAWFGK